jgi:hypothetical protein
VNSQPDLTAPGVSILAGWSPAASPSEDPSDTRAFGYNILSGTSMSTPHVAGAAALVKAAHPDWSPAAIKSALMTTGVATLQPMLATNGRNKNNTICHSNQQSALIHTVPLTNIMFLDQLNHSTRSTGRIQMEIWHGVQVILIQRKRWTRA